jgi:hypothetical protein
MDEQEKTIMFGGAVIIKRSLCCRNRIRIKIGTGGDGLCFNKQEARMLAKAMAKIFRRIWRR